MAKKFDPTTTVSSEYGIFGIPLEFNDCDLILLPVPWEVTTSYGNGASAGPELVRQASEQIDLFDLDFGKVYERGIHMLPIPQEIVLLNSQAKVWAQEAIKMITHKDPNSQKIATLQAQVNAASAKLNDWVYNESLRILKSKKQVGLVGGDHSSPYGLIKALMETHSDAGLLHIDAHADLRDAYQGFQFSHASIMRNVMELPIPPERLVQVGIRDFCEEEFIYAKNHPQISSFYDGVLKAEQFCGTTWQKQVSEIIRLLPKKIYLSFDIDGLNPQFCPHTGTPVPGGLTTDQVFFLFAEIVKAGKIIIGFDLNEVSSGGLSHREAEWDGNVGARVLYKLCCATLKS